MVKAHKTNLSGNLHLQVPEGWKASPADILLSFTNSGEEQQIEITVYPPSKQSEGVFKAVFDDGKGPTAFSLVSIAYEHIPTQLVLEPGQTSRV